jgi:hypothetical protein
MQTFRIVIGYKDIFEDEPNTIDEYLNGIDKLSLIKILTFLLERTNTIKEPANSIEYVRQYFSGTNNEIKQYVINKIYNHAHENKNDLIVFSSTTILELLSLTSSMVDSPRAKPIEQIEIDFFKIILIKNDVFLDKERSLINSINSKPIDKLTNELYQIIVSQIPSFELINHNPANVLVTQAIKSIFLFKYLDSSAETKVLKNIFLNKFCCDTPQEYLKHIISILKGALAREKTTIELNINDPEYLSQLCLFNGFCYSDDKPIVETDYITLRSYPIYNESINNYRVVYSLFLMDQLFRTMYFNLRDINNDMALIPAFRSFYTKNFSEEFLLYNILDTIYKGRYKKIKGLELENNGIKNAPDYYLRSPGKIYLFESKDILFNAGVKISFDDNIVISELQKKLYMDGTTMVGVGQIAKMIKKIIVGEFQFDEFNSTDKIYPILILHERLYNLFGLNMLVNQWFDIELQKMKDEGLDVSLVRPVTIIDIDTLIDNDILFDRKNQLGTLIDEYYSYLSKLKYQYFFKSPEHQMQVYMQKYISFSFFLGIKFPKKMKYDFNNILSDFINS